MTPGPEGVPHTAAPVDPDGDWPRLVGDLIRLMGRHEAQTDRLIALCERLGDLAARDLEAREAAAALERARVALEGRQLDRREEATARAELAAAAEADRRRDWWERWCDRGRQALGSPHVDRLLAGTVGAVLLALGWLVARLTGGGPPALGGP